MQDETSRSEPATGSGPVKTKSSWFKRITFVASTIVFILVALLIGFRYYLTTSSGARWIEARVNTANFGPVDSVKISGLSGDPLGAFSLSSIHVKDPQGIWMIAKDVSLEWQPLSLLKRHVDIQKFEIRTIDVARKPNLQAQDTTKSASKTSGLSLPKISLDVLELRNLNLKETVIGREVSLEIQGQFQSEKSGFIRSNLNIKSSLEDALSVKFTRLASGELNGDFNINAAPSGGIAALLQTSPEAALTGTGAINGTTKSGSGSVDLKLGPAEFMTAQSQWSQTSFDLNGRANIAKLPPLGPLSQRAGETVKIELSARRSETDGFNAQPFSAKLTSSALSATAKGNISAQGGLPQSAEVTFNAAKTSTLLSLPNGYSVGASRAQGQLTLSPNYGFKGTAELKNISSPYGSSQSIGGPLTLTLNAQNILGAKIDLRAKDIEAKQLEGFFAKDTRLTLTADYNSKSKVVNARELTFTSGSQRLSAKGKFSTGLENVNIKGDLGLTLTPQIKTAAAIPSGALTTDFALLKTPRSEMALSADGRYEITQSEQNSLQGSLIGQDLIYSVRMSPMQGGANLERFRVETRALTAEMSGTIADNIKILGEIQTRETIAAGGLSLDSNTSASFDLSGPRDNLGLRLDARSENIRFNDISVETPRLRAEISDLLTTPTGPLQVEAETDYGPLRASANVNLGDIKSAKDIFISVGALQASGDIAADANNLLTGSITLGSVSSNVSAPTAQLNLSPQNVGEDQAQGVTLAVDAAAFGYNKFAFDRLLIDANGTFGEAQILVDASIEALGTYDPAGTSQNFEIKTPLQIVRNANAALEASSSPIASWNDLTIASRAPVTLSLKEQDIDFMAPLSLGGHDLDISYTRDAGIDRLLAKTANMPLNLLPLPVALEDTLGRIGADIDIQHDGTFVRGTSTISLLDWRGFEAQKGDGLNADLSIKLGESSQASWAITGSSQRGFTIKGDGVLPLLPNTTLSQTRLDMNAPITGNIDARGSAITPLGLFTPNETEIEGTVELAVRISGSAANPNLSGRAQAKALAFEAPQIGTQIREGQFTADFTNDSLTLSRMALSDTSGGRITGSGEFKLGEFGRPIGTGQVEVSKFTALDRKDVKAVISGNLMFESLKNSSALSGALRINKANIRQFVSGAASVIDIETEEINRPPTLNRAAPKPKGNPTALNINIRAPRNILINSKGLDIEMSMDASIKGTSAAPLFTGSAEVIRGGYKIAGRTLQFETGRIDFNGPLERATVSLLAVTETQNLTARVNIGGTVGTPEITLSSTPERPQDEVLSALLFGRSVTELSALESVQLAGALAQFSGLGSGFDLLGGLRESLGITQLNIGTAADGSTQISGGRYLAKNVYLQLFSGRTLDQTGVIIDWEIRPNIALRSQALSDNDQSLSLKWKKDF